MMLLLVNIKVRMGKASLGLCQTNHISLLLSMYILFYYQWGFLGVLFFFFFLKTYYDFSEIKTPQ